MLYPKLLPRSPSMIRRAEVLELADHLRHVPRRGNWPFLTCTAAPVRAAASNRSVWRHRKAGICRTSTASATGRQMALVHIGEHGTAILAAHLGQGLDAFRQAEAARVAALVRFALSKLLL